jgi:NAD(P)-dependent dehydrogenase (short-subunit alcohol dehydrogenase family)
MALTISLDDHVAVVTGASSGIGAQIARSMGEAGARVVLVGRDAGRLEAVRADVERLGVEGHVVTADLERPEAATEIVEAAVAACGHIDCLVHCAGVFLVAPVDESLDLLDRQWQVNVGAPFRLTLTALPELRRRKGSVVFLSSVAGQVGFPGAAAYCATKGAIELLTRALAVEEAPNGVRVNAIAPGNIETPMNAHLMADPAYLRDMIEATPAGRNGRVDDIAPLAVWLASSQAAYMTGESVRVDGGWAAQ